MRVIRVLGLVLLLSHQACTDEFEPSLLDTPQILALRAVEADPTNTGGPYTLEALTHQVDGLTWTVCGAPWQPTEDGVICPTPSFDLPQANNAPLSAALDLDSLGLPDEVKSIITSLYIKASAEDPAVVPAVLSVNLKTSIENPPVSGVTLDGKSPAEWSIGANKVVDVTPVWTDDDAGKDTVTAFYTTEGAFDPWRVVGGGGSQLTLSTFSEPVTIYVITRHVGHGTTWQQLELSP